MPTQPQLGCPGALLLMFSILSASTVVAQTARVRVEIEGLGGDLKDNALAVASIVAAAREGELPTTQIRRLYTRGPEEIELALQPFGYYRPTIRSDLQTTDSTWVARYDVDPGPPITLHRVDLRLHGAGTTDSVLVSILAAFPLAEGDTLRHLLYDEGKLALASATAQRGYLDAVFDTARIRIDLEAYTAEIVLHLDTGPRYFFGPVTFNQDILDPRLLQGYVTFQPGDTFELSKLLALQSGLSASPYFGHVEVRPNRDRADSLQVPIVVDLTPRRRQRYEIGFGYGTDTGFRGTFEAEFRRLNRRGQNATLKLELSQIERTIAAQYRFPPAYPRTATYALFVGGGDFSPTWSDSRAAVAGVRRSVTRGPLREVLSLSYEGSNFEIAGQTGTSLLLIPGASWVWIRSDDRLHTQHGGRLRLDMTGSYDGVLSTASFVQLVLSGKLIRSPAPRTRLLVRAELGRTWANQFNELPPSLRFVTGGDNTVRGYSYESLGPRDEAGNIVGGDILAIASIETDYRILAKWALAVFFDTGNALDSLSSLSLAKGAGIGVRWASPVGPVRLDLAYGFDEPSENFRIHFTIGPDL
ncbi:MAG: autotransporter assembly complex family protein [Gemmatimonadota bacterium]